MLRGARSTPSSRISTLPRGRGYGRGHFADPVMVAVIHSSSMDGVYDLPPYVFPRFYHQSVTGAPEIPALKSAQRVIA